MPRQVQLCSWLRSEADVHVCLVCCCFFELSQHDESISEFVRSRLHTLCNFLLIYSVFHSIKLWFSIENLSFLLWGALVNRDYCNQLLRTQSGFIKKQLGLPFLKPFGGHRLVVFGGFFPPPILVVFLFYFFFPLILVDGKFIPVFQVWGERNEGKYFNQNRSPNTHNFQSTQQVGYRVHALAC